MPCHCSHSLSRRVVPTAVVAVVLLLQLMVVRIQGYASDMINPTYCPTGGSPRYMVSKARQRRRMVVVVVVVVVVAVVVVVGSVSQRQP